LGNELGAVGVHWNDINCHEHHAFKSTYIEGMAQEMRKTPEVFADTREKHGWEQTSLTIIRCTSIALAH
jgi:hypothetical protein